MGSGDVTGVEVSLPQMGYTSGPHGVKKTLREQYPSSFLVVGAHTDCIAGAGVDPQRSAVLIDMLIVAMGIPGSVQRYEEVLRFFKAVIVKRMVGGILALLFDEPEAVPVAKLHEQRLRDERRVAPATAAKRGRSSAAAAAAAEQALSITVPCSEDVRLRTGHGMSAQEAYSSNFTMLDLEQAADCHVFVRNRALRYRFFDFAIASLMEDESNDGLRKIAEQRKCVLIIDGVDTDHTLGTRAPTIKCYGCIDDAMLPLFIRSGDPIGEADVKMRDIDARVRRYFCSPCTAGTEQTPAVVLWDTVDTDELGILVLYMERLHAEACKNGVGSQHVSSFLFMKEHRGAGTPVEEGARYLLVNPTQLRDELLQDVRARHGTNTLSTPASRIAALQLVVGAFALGGCDFVHWEERKAAFKGRLLVRAAIQYAATDSLCSDDQPPGDIDSKSTPSDRMLEALRGVCTEAAGLAKESGRNGAKHGVILRNVKKKDTCLCNAAWAVRYWDDRKPHEDFAAKWGFHASLD
mgnify:CR=1 FL=1|tara:strand:- start:960 stop:2522 length:1563 start_codon:yes stop_codon:yes gene_type:complete